MFSGIHIPRAEWLAKHVGVTADELKTALAPPHYGRSVWYETPVDDEWIASYRLAPQNGRVVVAELRVFPIEVTRARTSDGSAGYWSGEVLGTKASVPRGGLTARLIKNSIRLGAHLAKADEALEWWRQMLLIEGTGLTGTEKRQAASHTPTRGRPGRPAIEYARLARTYAQAVASSRRNPTEVVAARHRLTIKKARDLVHKARSRGFLTGTDRGIAAGVLTPKAKAILTDKAPPKRRAR